MAYRVDHHEYEQEPQPRQPQRRVHILRLLKGTVDGTIEPDDAYKKLSRMPLPKAVLSAGQLALEEAVYAPDIDRSIEWLSKSAESFDRVLRITASEGRSITSPDGAQAALRKAQLPNYSSYIATGELPSPAIAKRALGSTIDVAAKLTQGIQDVSEDKHRSNTKHMLIGFLAEADVLALSQRYAVQEHPDQSWFPLIANHSDDHHSWSKRLAHEGWDVSIYTHLNERPELSYRLQVKSSRGALLKDKIDYSQAGIDVVCLNPDLNLPHDQYTVTAIADELVRDQSGDARAARRLDARMEKLLDILG